MTLSNCLRPMAFYKPKSSENIKKLQSENLLLRQSNNELIGALEWITEDMDMINSDKDMVSAAISNAQKIT